MYEDLYFLRETVVDIDAAVIGISRSRWVAVPHDDASQERASTIMRQERFDVLPITNGPSTKEYFHTTRWADYSVIERRSIIHRDVIPMHTHIRDVIKGFALEGRFFYFLHNEHRIVGLVSVANLNSRQTKVYLFSLLSELEIRLGEFICRHVPGSELLELTFGKSDNPKYQAVKGRYQEDKEKGVELPFVEYLYLSDLINVMINKKLHTLLGYNRTKFENVFGSLVSLRDIIAHPARSIITDTSSVEKLWNKIDNIESALFQLR